MADKNFKFEKNVLGAFFVDDQCIACKACTMEAFQFFEIDEMEGHAFVKKQPYQENQKEYQSCLEALKACPVDAIGKDGLE